MSWYQLRVPCGVETVHARVVESQCKRCCEPAIHGHGSCQGKRSSLRAGDGPHQQVLVREETGVRAGQTLVVLDDAALRSALEQAQSGLEGAQNAQGAAQTNASLATSTLNRYKQLESEKSVSPQEMDEVRSDRAAEAKP